MHAGDRLREGSHLIAQGEQKLLEAVRPANALSASVFGSRTGPRLASLASKPASACEMNMRAAERRDFASAKVCCIHPMSAWLRAAYSSGSGAVSHRLLHQPWMLSVAQLTPPKLLRRFSTQDTLPLTPRHSGVDFTAWRRRCCPSVNASVDHGSRGSWIPWQPGRKAWMTSSDSWRASRSRQFRPSR